MSTPHGDISHVSDTALMVAACRALETESSDGFVHDPFAARLAGDRGMAILNGLHSVERFSLLIGIRSRFLDELLLQALASTPISTVLSVGCGLDTRPWRLDLPPALRWIEVDFADMLDYKEALMATETPRCHRERLTADVNDPAQRHALYAAAGPSPALMITEGLLMYLPAATVRAMAAEVGRQSGVQHWIADIISAAMANASNSPAIQKVRQVQAPDALPGEQIFDTIRAQGWNPAAARSYVTDMAFAMTRVMRMLAAAGYKGAPPSVPPGDPSGVHLFARSHQA